MIDSSIYGQQVHPQFDVLGQLGRVNQLRVQQQQIASNQANEEARRQDIAKQARSEASQAKYFDIIRRSKDDNEADPLIKAEVPELYDLWVKKRGEIAKAAGELQKTTLERKKLDEEIAVKGQEYAAPYLQLLETNGYDPKTWNFVLGSIKGHGFDTEQMAAHTLGVDGAPDPVKIKALVDAFKSPAQQGADTTASRFAAEKPTLEANAKIQSAVAANLSSTGLTPVQQQQGAQTAAQQAQTAAAAAEAARHNRVQEGHESQRIAQSAGDKTELTPGGIDAAAMMYAKTGQLPPLGMGDKTTRKAIINRAAVMVPGLDVASAKADFDANKSSLSAMQKQRDAITAFEKTAGKNIDLFLETAGKVVDTGSPLANTYVRAVSGKVLGSPDQAAYDAARQVAINEIAKITQGGGLSGVLSDTARKEIGTFNPANATLAQTVRVMRTLKKDMENRTGSMDDAIEGIKQRIGKASDTGNAGAVKKYNPATGKVE